MKGLEKIAVQVGMIAAGVIVAGYLLNTFSDIAFVSDAKKGFNQ